MATAIANSNRRYAVFLSYRHADNKEQGRQWATWLHQVLESYEIPADLVGTANNRNEPIPQSLYPVFRDEEELPADADLTRNIQQALERSGLLVVICSPRAAESRFVSEEIRYFKELGNSDRILALMIDGEPNVSGDVGKQTSGITTAAECLPEPLRYGVAAENGAIDWSRRTEPIAADARPGGQPEQGWTTAAAYREALLKNGQTNEGEAAQKTRDYDARLELAKLKVIAGALGVPLGILTARDKAMQLQKAKQRARALRRWLAAVALLGLLALAGGVYAWRQKQTAQTAQRVAEEQKSRAQAAQEQAEKEKSRAEEALLKTRAALSQSDFLAATRSLEAGRVSDALAQLARSLSFNPRNEASLFRLTTLLTYRDFAAPLQYLKMEGQVQSAQLPPDPEVSESAKSILGKNAPTWDAEKQPPPMHAMFKDDPDSVRAFSLSPDERRLYIFSDYHFAQVWDARRGAAIKPPFKYGDRGDGTTTFLSPDGTRAVSVGAAVIRLWDTESGKPVAVLEETSNEANTAAEFSSDSKLLATAQGELLSLWDAQSGKSRNGPLAQEGTISLLRFSPDGTRLAATVRSAVRLWDTRTGKQIGAPLTHNADVVALRFSPDGRLLATAARDNSVRVWNAQNGNPATAALNQSAENSDMLAFAADGKRLLVASTKAFSVWDVPGGKQLLAPLNQAATISSARFDERGERVVTASSDRTARIWNAKTGAATVQPIVHPAEVQWAGFGNDGATLVTLLADVTGRVWDVRPGAALPTRLKADNAIVAAQFSRDGQRVLALSQGSMGKTTAHVWTAATANLQGTPTSYESTEVPEFSPDGTRLVTRSEKGAQLWDVASGRPVGGPLAHESFVMSAHFSAEGARVITASQDKTVKIWNAENGQPIGKPFEHEDKLLWASFTPDGKRIATSAEDKRIRIWDMASGAAVSEWEYVTYIASGEFSPDSRRLLTWTLDDMTARVWDVESGQPVGTPLQHKAQVHSARFSPDGRVIATASEDRTARLWDATTGKPLTDPLEHPADVTSVSFSPDGRQIVTVCLDKTIRIWDVETGKLLTDFFESDDVQSAQFSADGKRLLIAGQQLGVQLWDLVPRNKTAPPWLSALAEMLAGQRLDNNGVFQIIKSDPTQTRKEIEAQLQTGNDDDWNAWGRWWFGDRTARKISPFSQIDVAEQK